MNVEIMFSFIELCEKLGIKPTWEKLKDFAETVEQLNKKLK